MNSSAPRRDQLRDPIGVGRRVAFRREELGLTLADVAHRASTTTSYARSVEDGQASGLSTNVLMRFAGALETTTDVLLGRGIERPPGRSRPGVHPRIEALMPGECRQLLDSGGVGRFVFSMDDGPVAIPVNYRVVDNDVVFRTTLDTTLAAVGADEPVGFEIDHIDDAMSEGWSVLVRGHVEHVDDMSALRRLVTQGIEPWAGDGRDVYLRLTPTDVSGRRIRSR